MHRYLFLDFDGVLHTKTPPYDLRYAAHLVPIGTELDLKIVVSSTWREGFSLPELIESLGPLGPFVVGKTPVWKRPEHLSDAALVGVRQREIEAWLARKASASSPWVAIDDEAENFRMECSQVFVTDPKVGLDAQTTRLFNTWCREQFLGPQALT